MELMHDPMPPFSSRAAPVKRSFSSHRFPRPRLARPINSLPIFFPLRLLKFKSITRKRRSAMGKTEAKGDEKEMKDCCGKVDGPITVVLNVEMHCEGCAYKVRRSVKGFRGVEAVASDVSENKLTVIGKVNPLNLRSHIENKTHKKVDLVSPAVSLKKEKEKSKSQVKGDSNTLKLEKSQDQKKVEDKKPKEPTATVVVLSVRLHCEGCIQRIRKHVQKIKGVESVSFDSDKDLVTVKGTMDVKTLPELLTAKLKRGVEIVTPKKDAVGGKEKGSQNKSNNSGGKKDKILESSKTAPVQAPNEAPPAAPNAASAAPNPVSAEASKMDFYAGGYGNYPYRIEMVHAPQLFSDENPNACCIV